MLATALAACGGDDDDTEPATSDTASSTGTSDTGATPDATSPPEGSAAGSAGPTVDDLAAVATTYADLVYANYQAAIASVTEMQAAIDAFLADPTDATLAAAKEAWLTARDDYGPTEAFRFYDGPIDNPANGPEGQINAWPMDEAYVDYVDGDATAGIVNDTAGYPDITVDVIVEANEEGGETNISTGWHADRVPALGSGPVRGGPRRTAAHRLHDGRQRRAAGDVPAADHATAPRRPRLGRRPVGSGRGVPHRVPRRSGARGAATAPRHRRPVAWRARRRADGRRLRDQGPGGRAFLLQRQHRRRRHQQRPWRPDGVPRRLPRHRRPQSVRPRRGRRPRARRRPAGPAGDVGRAHERVPGYVRDDDRRPRRRPGRTRRCSKRSSRSRTRAT